MQKILAIGLDFNQDNQLEEAGEPVDYDLIDIKVLIAFFNFLKEHSKYDLIGGIYLKNNNHWFSEIKYPVFTDDQEKNQGGYNMMV